MRKTTKSMPGIRAASKPKSRSPKKRKGDSTFRSPKIRRYGKLEITAGTKGVEYKTKYRAKKESQNTALSEAHNRRILDIVGIANTVD
jgi:hypothetical protein